MNLSPFLSVAENLYLGHEIRGRNHLIDWRSTYAAAEKILSDMGMHMDVHVPLNRLTAAQQQMVAIARAVLAKAKVLILDEATSSLDADEVQVLFREIRKLKNAGMGIIYITHRMNEVFEISDRITILRNGHLVGVYFASEIDMHFLVSSMIGNENSRSATNRKPIDPTLKDAPVLYGMKNICKKNRLHNVSFGIKKGEILGLAGLLGSGRTEIARIIFGDDDEYTGEKYMDGKPIRIRSPRDSIAQGIAYCTEERRSEGIFALMGVDDNIIMPSLDNYAKVGIIDRKKKKATAARFIKKLAIKPQNAQMPIRKLSGGNQQKALVARWLCMDMRLMIFDEPTRGIDVGAKSEIEKLIQSLARSGLSVLLISSEFEELVRSCDRILVLCEGRIVAELSGEDISYENILSSIAQGNMAIRKNGNGGLMI